VTERWRRELAKLDQVTLPRGRPRSTGVRVPLRPSGPSRILTAVVALAIGTAGTVGWLAIAYWKHPSPDEPQPVPVDTVPLGADGSILWPDTTQAELVELQADADEGRGYKVRLYLTPEGTTTLFAEWVLGWVEGSYEMQAAQPGSDGASVVIRLVRTAQLCPPPTGEPQNSEKAKCFNSVEDVTIVQPVRQGEGGIWAVQRVASPTAGIEAVPGQVVVNRDLITAHLELEFGLRASMGSLISRREPPCSSGFHGGEPPNPNFSIPVRVQPDAQTGTSCGASAPGIVWVATGTFILVGPNSAPAYPLYGDSTPYVAVTAVPISVTIPENVPAEGFVEYTDPQSWMIEHPTAWIVTPFEDQSMPLVALTGAAFSNVPLVADLPNGLPRPPKDDAFADGVALVIEHVDGGPVPDRLSNDSRFPLDPADATSAQDRGGWTHAMSFRGNGIDYHLMYAIGPEATDADVQALMDMIGTIHFPTLRMGDREEHGGWVYAGDPQWLRLGRGSSTYIYNSHLQVVYVIRLGGVNYALDVPELNCEGANETWDDQTRQVLMESPCFGDVRYDLDGTPDPDNPPGFLETLTIHPVIEAWDGSLLIVPGTRLGAPPG